MNGQSHRRRIAAGTVALVWAVATIVASPAGAATLLLHSTMDNADISGTTVYDVAVPAQNGTLDAAATSGAAGVIGQAIDSVTASGVGAVDYGDVLDAGAGIQTISIWFNADTIKTQGVVRKGNAGSTNIGWSIFLESRNSGAFHRVAVRASATGVGDNPNRAIAWADLAGDGSDSTGVWHHVAFVMDASAGSVSGYLNGVLMTATNSWGLTFTTDVDGVATTEPILAGIGFDGRLDDLRIYDGALTQQEITNLYNSGIPEPASVGLLGLGWLMMGTRRQRAG
ncbi:MAG: LamG domain-containing protein [Phycisphaeraceae bacterium]|nr:LamG domain-containing protein [Phycisphaeraceae bacterium]